MAKKPVGNKAKKALVGSPITKLRDLIGWSRQEGANYAGVSLASLQNYERGFAPLPLEVARALETACGVNASHLHEQCALWLKSGGKEQVEGPRSMGGNAYTKDTFQRYRNVTLSATAQANAIKDITCRVQLLLGPLGEKPHLFRIAYRTLVQTLDAVLKQTSLSTVEMSDFASQGAKVEEFEWSLGELAAEPDVAASPVWMKNKPVERFRILDSVKIQKTEFAFWPAIGALPCDEDVMIPDWILCTRYVWRITLPDKTQMTIPIDKFHTAGLVSKVTAASQGSEIYNTESGREVELTHYKKEVAGANPR